jgi:hypothetical protein
VVSKTISAAKTTTTTRASRIRISRVVPRTVGPGQGLSASPISFLVPVTWSALLAVAAMYRGHNGAGFDLDTAPWRLHPDSAGRKCVSLGGNAHEIARVWLPQNSTTGYRNDLHG